MPAAERQSVDGAAADPSAAVTSGAGNEAASGSAISGLRGQVVAPSRQAAAGQEFTLSDLEDCTVFLLAPLAALVLHGLRRCRVYTGPVAGACFVEGACWCGWDGLHVACPPVTCKALCPRHT